MKIRLLFFLLSTFISAQKNQFIELRRSIKDRTHAAQSLTLLDRREDKFIGIISHRKDPYEVKFEKEAKIFSGLVTLAVFILALGAILLSYDMINISLCLNI